MDEDFLKKAQNVYSGPRFDVVSLKIKNTQRDVILHPGAVVILPLFDHEHLIMIRNERFAVGKELWELPAGTLEKGESPLETAHRELIEETGYRAANIEPLTQFYTSPGFCNELMHAYVATGLTHVGQHLDESEKIVVEPVTWRNALAMANDGTIEDGKTLATLLYYKAFFK